MPQEREDNVDNERNQESGILDPCYPVLAVLDGTRVLLGDLGGDLVANLLELIACLVESDGNNESNRADEGENPEEPEHGAVGFYETALANDSTNETRIFCEFSCA
jgi:hypothetical protein